MAVDLAAGTNLRLRADSGIASLVNAGTVQVNSGLDISGDYSASGSSLLHVTSVAALPITVGGDASLAGSLTLPAGITGSSVTLLSAASVTGSWSVTNLPAGYQLVTSGTTVILQQTTPSREIHIAVTNSAGAVETEVFVEQSNVTVYNQTAENHAVTGLMSDTDSLVEFLEPIIGYQTKLIKSPYLFGS